jgi:hypothetical protein
MNVWRMKTFKEAALRFTDKEYIAIDEMGIDTHYGSLSIEERSKLFRNLDLQSMRKRKWGLIKRYFDEFYDCMQTGDVVVIGTGKASSSYYVKAIGKVISEAYFCESDKGEKNPRHRRKVDLLWQDDPIEVAHWGQSKKLERLNTVEKLQDYVELFTEIFYNNRKR